MDPTLAPAAVVAERKTGERASDPRATRHRAVSRDFRAPPRLALTAPLASLPFRAGDDEPVQRHVPRIHGARPLGRGDPPPRVGAPRAVGDRARAKRSHDWRKEYFSLFSDRSPPPLSLSLLLSQGAGYGAANAGADASAAVKAEAGKTGFDPAQARAVAADCRRAATRAERRRGSANRRRRLQSRRGRRRDERHERGTRDVDGRERAEAAATEAVEPRVRAKEPAAQAGRVRGTRRARRRVVDGKHHPARGAETAKDACGSLETDNKTLADKLKVIKGDDVEAAAEGGKKTSPTKKGGKAADADGGKD